MKPTKQFGPPPHALHVTSDGGSTSTCLATAAPQRAYKDTVTHENLPALCGSRIKRFIARTFHYGTSQKHPMPTVLHDKAPKKNDKEAKQVEGSINTKAAAKLIEILALLAFKIKNYYARAVSADPHQVVFISKFCIKSAAFTNLAEAEAMIYVSKRTTVPIPKVYHAFEHKGRTYIVMEKLPGQNLALGWTQRSPESKAQILNQLQMMVQEIRGIPPPKNTGVANICGGPICNQRLPNDFYWGPFASILEFHRALRNNVENSNLPQDELGQQVQQLITFHNTACDTPILTHGDLSSFNIMVDGDKVVGIIDWETAGWMPDYWEYTSAWDVNPHNQFWQAEVDKFLFPRHYSLQMEQIRKRYFGDW